MSQLSGGRSSVSAFLSMLGEQWQQQAQHITYALTWCLHMLLRSVKTIFLQL